MVELYFNIIFKMNILNMLNGFFRCDVGLYLRHTTPTHIIKKS